MTKYKCVCGYEAEVHHQFGINEVWINAGFIDINKVLKIEGYKQLALMGCPKCHTVQYEYR